jgi:hypothetical protein
VKIDLLQRLFLAGLLVINLSACSNSDSEFEKQVNESWEEAFRKAQLDPCSIEASSIRTTGREDPRFEAWAKENPLSACPERTYSGNSADCGGYDDNGNYVKISCEEIIGQIVGSD